MAFGGSIKLTGESEYRKALTQITQNLKVVSAEMKATTTAFESGDKSVDELARDLIRYNITSIRDNAFSSIKSCESAANKLIELVMTMRKNSKVDSPYKKIIELDHFKVENNKVYDNQMRKLFTNEKDPIEVIKWKDIYTSLRSIFESYEYISELCEKYLIYKGW